MDVKAGDILKVRDEFLDVLGDSTRYVESVILQGPNLNYAYLKQTQGGGYWTLNFNEIDKYFTRQHKD